MNKKERIEQAFPGIAQAIENYNDWSLSASIMIDLSDCHVWLMSLSRIPIIKYITIRALLRLWANPQHGDLMPKYPYAALFPR